jgi:hypothetical protein
MRRALASLLLVLYSFLLIGPALLANGASNIPSCCRRDGKHRCAAMSKGDPDGASADPAIQTAAKRCPYFPKAAAVPAFSQIALTIAVRTTFGPPLTQSSIQRQSESLHHISFSRCRQKRGPPNKIS